LLLPLLFFQLLLLLMSVNKKKDGMKLRNLKLSP